MLLDNAGIEHTGIVGVCPPPIEKKKKKEEITLVKVLKIFLAYLRQDLRLDLLIILLVLQSRKCYCNITMAK